MRIRFEVRVIESFYVNAELDESMIEKFCESENISIAEFKEGSYFYRERFADFIKENPELFDNYLFEPEVDVDVAVYALDRKRKV